MISIEVVRDKTSAVATLRERDSSETFCSFEVVKFIRDVACQKLSKSVNISRSYSKKSAPVF